MKKEVGLWIDHRKTIIVTVIDGVEVIREIHSNMEKHVRFSSGSRSKDPEGLRGSSAEDVRDRQFGDHLGRYYEGVISLIRGADSILIFGPGEAKNELGNQLKQAELGEHIVGIEAVDKMTEPQIAAKVRDYFVSRERF
jgi:stalled ribosome rescue protein Dom34